MNPEEFDLRVGSHPEEEPGFHAPPDPEEFDLRVGSHPEEEPGFHAPPDPDCPSLDPKLLGLPATPANVEALRTAGAMEDFKEELFADDAYRMKMFMHAAKSQMAEGRLAVARTQPKSNALGEALRVVGDVARKRGGKLWPEVRDAMLVSCKDQAPLAGGVTVQTITGRGFADAYSKADLKGIRITFELADGSVKTLAGQTAYDYIMTST